MGLFFFFLGFFALISICQWLEASIPGWLWDYREQQFRRRAIKANLAAGRHWNTNLD